MKKYPKVSLLILNWNGLKYTINCIKSLLQTDYPNFEIIVVDNCSKIDESSILEKEFKGKITVIKSKINLGYAGGMNVGYAHSSGEYIMFVNNDMEFEKDWLKPLVMVFINNPTIGGCQPKLRQLIDRESFDYAVAAGGFIDIFGYPFARGRIFTYVEKDKGQYDSIVKISWCGIFLVRRKVLEKTGLFDPIFFNYGEDMDLCFRIYGQGYSIVNVPHSIGYHYGGGVLKKNLAQKMFFHHRNNLIFIFKNFEIKTILLIIFPRFALDFLSIFYYLRSGSMESSLAVVKAYISLFLLSKKIVASRRSAQSKIQRKNIRKMPIYKGSVIWDYFILRKKTFKEIMKEGLLLKISIL